jgi:hypothetical protein
LPDRAGGRPLAAGEGASPIALCIETPLFFALIAVFAGQKGVCFEPVGALNPFVSNKFFGLFPRFSIFFRLEACRPPRGVSGGFRRKEAS